jgi:acyl-coenzyme A synthetase/AMP-(fatty) acid ligase
MFCEPFWRKLRAHGDRIALIDALSGSSLSYRELADAVQRVADSLRCPTKAVVFLFSETDIAGVVCYLGALLAGHAVYLSPRQVEHPSVRQLIRAYQPEFVLWKVGVPSTEIGGEYTEGCAIEGYQALIRVGVEGVPPNDSLAIMLSTSGSTGSGKLVRLSAAAVSIAAEQVVQALRISKSDRAIASLPMSYVYGLSVVNTHLSAGASLVLERRSTAHRAFWESIRRTGVTTLPGVSITYDFMEKLHVENLGLTSLRKLTHSGEAVNQRLLDWLLGNFANQGAELFLMYGQSEAAGRISVLAPELLPAKRDSVGMPVRFGCVTISEGNEVIFQGPNVMLGYAERRLDLSRGDELSGLLHTGDQGYMDENGLLYITGRLSRRCKVLGERINLDEVESCFADLCAVAALAGDGKIIIFCEGTLKEVRLRALDFAREARLPVNAVVVRQLQSLPRTHTGKPAYQTLSTLVTLGDARRATQGGS